jgi:hypothetical protein
LPLVVWSLTIRTTSTAPIARWPLSRSFNIKVW